MVVGNEQKHPSQAGRWILLLIMALILMAVAVVILAVILAIARSDNSSQVESIVKPERPMPSIYCQRTPWDIQGPFFKEKATERGSICGASTAGRKLIVHGYVLQEFCKKSIPGAILEIWQANDNGTYVDECRATLFADKKGYFRFETTHPGHYWMETFWRASHIHYKVSLPDRSEWLVTQQYFADDKYVNGQVPSLLSQTRPLDADKPEGHRVVEFNFIMSRPIGSK